MTREEAKDFYEVIKAYSEGKIIQQSSDYKNWRDVEIDANGEVEFDFNYFFYRIKPEQEYHSLNN